MFTRFNRWNTNLNLDVDDPGAGGGGDGFPAYQDQMTDDLKRDKDIAKNATISDLGRAYKTQLATIANMPEKAPENAEGYAFDAVTYPEGQSGDPEFEKQFRAMALTAKLNKAQANQAFQFFAKTVLDQLAASKTAFEANKTAADEQLKKDWPGEEYAKNMLLKDRYVKQFGDEEMQKDLDETGMGNKPSFLKQAVKVAKAVGEDALGPGGPKSDAVATDKEKVLRELYPNSAELFGGPKGPGPANKLTPGA